MKKLAIAATVTFAISASLMAQEGEPRGPQEAFRKLDLNANGVVTHSELMQEAQKKLAQFDQNQNGVIVLEELPEKMPLPARAERRLAHMKERAEAREQAGEAREHAGEERRGRRGPKLSLEEREEKMRPTRIKFMARMDKDGDEQLTVEEIAVPMIKRFKRADVNGDGEVTQAEFEQSMEQRRHKRGGKMKQERRR